MEEQVYAFQTSALGVICQLHASDAFHRGKKPRYTLDRRLGGPQSRSGGIGKEQNLSSYRESNPGHPARSLVTILTELRDVRFIQPVASLCPWLELHHVNIVPTLSGVQGYNTISCFSIAVASWKWQIT
jgi:hypothetical protein